MSFCATHVSAQYACHSPPLAQLCPLAPDNKDILVAQKSKRRRVAAAMAARHRQRASNVAGAGCGGLQQRHFTTPVRKEPAPASRRWCPDRPEARAF